MPGDHLTIYHLGGTVRPDPTRVGEKAVRLWQMRASGLRVPDGLVLPVETVAQLVGRLENTPGAPAGGASGDEVLRRLRARGGPPADFDAVLRALGRVDGYQDGALLAVRSAAIGEDSAQASFAGQYTTVLGATASTLWDALLQCYGAWWSPQATTYRLHLRSPVGAPALSVIVQRQLGASCAGVAFSRDPVTAADLIVIEAAPGLGDRVVSGEVSPARWHVAPRTAKVLRFTPGDFPELGLRAAFVTELAGAVERAERLFGPALDIEWAVEDGRLFLLQCRAITTRKRAGSVEDAVRSVYTRRVLEDLWSDRMSPITSSVMFDELSDIYTFKTVLRRLGLREVAAMRAVAVLDGYAYLSTAVALKLVELLPAALRIREVADAFPPAIRERALQTPFRPWRACRAACGAPLLLLGDLAALPFLTAPLLRRHLRRVGAELDRVPVAEYGSRDADFYTAELDRVIGQLKRLLVRNQWGYGHATLFLWLLHHVATRYVGRSQSWVLARIRTLPPNVTGELHRRLNAIVGACDGEVRACLLSDGSDADVWAALVGRFGNHPAAGLTERLVADFRYRSGNRDFVHPRWDEEPERVVGWVRAALRERQGSPDPARGCNPATRDAPSFTARLVDAAMDAILVNPTRRFLALREDLRFGLDKAFYRIRRLLLAAGGTAPLAPLRAVGDEAVFFLDLHELRAVLRGTLSAGATIPWVRERLAAFERDRRASPPVWVSLDESGMHDLSPADGPGAGMSGVAASPGVARGRATVVYGPEDFHKVRNGDILVAYNTDPGWTPLFLKVAGVVVEMGGVLNHCAIVAREYGIPAVVGVAGITKRVADGDTVTVNGYLGVVDTAPTPSPS
jgi:pyruvate,water dikinase